MKKSLISIYAIAATLFFFSSCGKEQTTPTEQHTSEPQTYTLTISATKAPSTKSYDLDGSTLNTVWDEGDVVTVLHGEPKVAVGTLTPISCGESTTTLSGTINANISVGDWIDLWIGNGLDNQDGTLETLNSNQSDRAKAWFQVKEIDESKKIVPDGDVSFNNWQAVVKFTVKNGDNLLPVSKMVIKAANGNLEGGDGHELTITPSPSSPSSVLFVAIDNSTQTDDNYEIRVQASDGWYSLPATDKNFERGHYYDVTLKVTKEGSLTLTVAGTPASVFGTEWATNVAANDLSYDAVTGNYKLELTVPGDINYIQLKVVANHNWGTEWPSDKNYVVEGFSANGYSKTLTITYNPRNNAISHTLVQNESPYTLYVKDEELATAAKWGSSRECWSGEGYQFNQKDDVDGYKCFAIPHAIADGESHDLYYLGDNGCEVKLDSFASTSETNYFKTNGFEIVPSNDSYTSEKRVWVQTNLSTIYAHMWQSSNSSNSTDWETCQMSTNYSKYDGRYWYYSPISTGWDKLILSWADRNDPGNNADGPQRVHYDISASQNYYYYVTYNSDSDYYYGSLFSGGWE